MKKSLQITAMASIITIAVVFGIFTAQIDEPRVTGHASLDRIDLKDHIAKRDYIIIGTVKQIGPPYDVKSEYAPRTFADVTITVDEVLRGNITEKEIIIRTYPMIEEEVEFTVGEKSILFLIKSTAENVEGEGVFVVSGMNQGKFTIKDNDKLLDAIEKSKEYSVSDIIQQIKSRE